MKIGMSFHHHCHVVTRNCEHTQVKIHTVAELLLLSGSLRPIRSETTSSIQNSLTSAKEQLQSSLTIILEIVGDITKSMNDLKARWKVVCDMLYRLSDAVIVLVELCYHVTYQCLTSGRNVDQGHAEALVDKYAASYAGLEIKLSCVQLKRARLEELTASFIMDMCSNISKYISVLTDNCRNASENASDSSTRDQFKLGVKSVTCATGSLIASIKSYKGDKSARHHSRVVTFCEPVLAASHALVCLATEEEFIDKGIELSDKEKEIQKSVFGPCMNIVSGCVQVCKVLRDFTYDTTNTNYLHKAKSCQSSIHKSTNQLKFEMQKHCKIDFQVKGVSPVRADERGQNSTESFKIDNGHEVQNHRELSPFSRSSPQPGGSYSHDDHLGDHSPRSSLAPSDLSFSTGSLSR